MIDFIILVLCEVKDIVTEVIATVIFKIIDFTPKIIKKIKKLFKFIRTIFCKHDFGRPMPNPFKDEFGNESVTQTCKKCGKKKMTIFYKWSH